MNWKVMLAVRWTKVQYFKEILEVLQCEKVLFFCLRLHESD